MTVTAPTPLRHRVSTVAKTTDAQTPDKDDVKSGDESLAVIENTSIPDKSRNNCTPCGDVQKRAPRLDVLDVSLGMFHKSRFLAKICSVFKEWKEEYRERENVLL